jgi:hypothetical protein
MVPDINERSDPVQVLGGVTVVAPFVLDDDPRVGDPDFAVITRFRHPARCSRVERGAFWRGQVKSGMDYRTVWWATHPGLVEMGDLWNAAKGLGERVTLRRHRPHADVRTAAVFLLLVLADGFRVLARRRRTIAGISAHRLRHVLVVCHDLAQLDRRFPSARPDAASTIAAAVAIVLRTVG